MSQFLICKSKENLSILGIPYVKNSYNMGLYNSVIERYLGGITKDIWIIEAMGDWLYDIEHSISYIDFLARKSDTMVFWYGNEFDDLDMVYSIDELMRYIKNEANDPSFELYLIYKNKYQYE